MPRWPYAIQNPHQPEVLDGHRSASATTATIRSTRTAQRAGGGQSRYRPQDGTQVPPTRQTAQRGQTYEPRLPHTARSFRRGLAATARAAPAQPGTGGQNLVCGPTKSLSGTLYRWPTADVAATHQAVACSFWTGQGGVLLPGSPSGTPVRQRLHVLHRSARDHRRCVLRPLDLPLRLDLLELGDGNDLLRRELREPQRGLAECLVGIGWRAADAPHRPADSSHSTGDGRFGVVHAALPGVATSLRSDGPGHPGGACSRERRRGAKPSPVQTDVGPGPDAAWQPRLRQPHAVRGVLASFVRASQRRAANAAGRGITAVTSVAVASPGIVPATVRACGPGQHHPRSR
jgi:hypothetical protein